MRAPQLILMVLYGVSLGTHIAKHGELKKGTYNCWYAMAATAIVMFLLWWGGFFA